MDVGKSPQDYTEYTPGIYFTPSIPMTNLRGNNSYGLDEHHFSYN